MSTEFVIGYVPSGSRQYIDEESSCIIIPNPSEPITEDGTLVAWQLFAKHSGMIALDVRNTLNRSDDRYIPELLILSILVKEFNLEKTAEFCILLELILMYFYIVNLLINFHHVKFISVGLCESKDWLWWLIRV